MIQFKNILNKRKKESTAAIKPVQIMKRKYYFWCIYLRFSNHLRWVFLMHKLLATSFESLNLSSALLDFFSSFAATNNVRLQKVYSYNKQRLERTTWECTTILSHIINILQVQHKYQLTIMGIPKSNSHNLCQVLNE